MVYALLHGSSSPLVTCYVVGKAKVRFVWFMSVRIWSFSSKFLWVIYYLPDSICIWIIHIQTNMLVYRHEKDSLLEASFRLIWLWNKVHKFRIKILSVIGTKLDQTLQIHQLLSWKTFTCNYSSYEYLQKTNESDKEIPIGVNSIKISFDLITAMIVDVNGQLTCEICPQISENNAAMR